MTYLTKSFEKGDFNRMLALLNFWKKFIHKFTWRVLRDPMFSTFATILSFHHQQLSSSSPFPRSRLTSTRKQRSSMTTAKFILPVPGLLCNVQFIYTFLFFSICHRSRFRSSFLIQGLVIQAHLCLSPMVPICGTL